MPLPEFHRGKPESNHSCSSGLSPFMPDNEFGELLWENGQIVVQGQSHKPKKTTFPTPFPYDNIKVQEKEGRDAAIPKIGLFETMDSSMVNLNGSSISAPVPLGLHPQVDDDMDPWINYQAEEDPFCSEFYSELSGIPDSLSNDRNNGLGVRDLHNAEHGHTSRGLGQEPSRSKAQQCQSLIPSSRPRVTDFSASGGGGSSLNSHGHLQKPLQVGGGVMSFSSFSRPVTRTKANDDHTYRLKSTKEASAAPSTNPVESTLTDPAGVRGGSATDLAKKELGSAANPLHLSVETSEAFIQNNVATDNRSFDASMAIGRHAAEQGPEAIVASSVCSGSSPGSGSNDTKHRDKRKNRKANESGFLSEDLEDDSFGERRPPTARAGSSTKRSRTAQVHNQSERRRRERINEKMRALQELIPNCNKVDKASMLDEAIEYLKTLQLQVQMMSMRSGLCMSPMMLPPGTQHFRAPPMAHFSPMGLGMGMGTFYMNGCPMIPVPPMHALRLCCWRSAVWSPWATGTSHFNASCTTLFRDHGASDAYFRCRSSIKL